MTIGNLLATREQTHGDYRTKADTIQSLKRRMRCPDGWDNLTPYQRESLEMIASKIGRILHGNADEIDHWQDIAGYAMLVVRELEARPTSAAGGAEPPPGNAIPPNAPGGEPPAPSARPTGWASFGLPRQT